MIWQDGLLRPLTPTEMKVARLVSIGYDQTRIAALLGMARRTAGIHVGNIALKIPNPDDIKPSMLVVLWCVEQRLREEKKYAA